MIWHLYSFSIHQGIGLFILSLIYVSYLTHYANIFYSFDFVVS